MPYIKKEDRDTIQPELDNLIGILQGYDTKKIAGMLNYINCMIFKYAWRCSYFWFCIFVGTLLLTILEVWRRVICQYEDGKIEENGEVF